MSNILILFAHPALEKSRVNAAMVDAVADLPGVTFHDLYEEYPTFNVDVKREQALLEEHDVIVLQHPLYWYSTPALVKQWEDMVLEHGWAYGSTGDALRGKYLLNAITAGGTETMYNKSGKNQADIRQFLLPLQQTASLCGMTYLPPFMTYGTHRMEPEHIAQAAESYRLLIQALRDDEIRLNALDKYNCLNDVLENMTEEPVQ